ncbi:hypothetical protein [Arsenophonus sp. PmNCSU2021_1]|uniref:hypothetical protein n=1 Tax=Arsenophonus sp. PmNCSU2021_1 TaxID=3118989 RepID=UPI002FF36A87
MDAIASTARGGRMKSTIVHIVSTIGFENEMEAVAAFSTYKKAYDYVKKNGFSSFHIDELIIDEEEEE